MLTELLAGYASLKDLRLLLEQPIEDTPRSEATGLDCLRSQAGWTAVGEATPLSA